MERVYSPKVLDVLPDRTPPPSPVIGATTRRRRLPSPAEQERRVKWGKEWGARVSKATAQLRKG